MPVKDVKYEVVDMTKPRVMKHNSHLLDSNDRCERHPNIELLKQLNIECELTTLSTDYRFTMLQRYFIGELDPMKDCRFLWCIGMLEACS